MQRGKKFKKPAYETDNSIETKTETKANYCETVIEIKRWFRDYAGLEAYNISDSCPATLGVSSKSSYQILLCPLNCLRFACK